MVEAGRTPNNSTRKRQKKDIDSSTKDQVDEMETDDHINSTIEELEGDVHALTTIIVNQTPINMQLFSSSLQAFLNGNAIGEKTLTSTKFKEPAPKLDNTTNRAGVSRKLFPLNNGVQTRSTVLCTHSTPSGYQCSRTTHQPPKLIGSDIPDWMHGVFRPTQDMMLNAVEVAVVAYIFGIVKDDKSNGKEILISTESKLCSGDRSLLKTLLPKGLVDQDVLNLLACDLTHEVRSWTRYSSDWFLPTMFAQFALSWTRPPTTLMEHYRKEFMGKVDYVTKIFVPINEDNMHWYLLIIDLSRRELILLDSKPFPSRHASRRRNIKFLALYIEEMLQHDCFYDFYTTNKPIISEYNIVEPEINEQKDGSNDCGIWVATWMRECKYRTACNIQVGDGTRLRLALDLVLNPYNKLKEKVIRKAFRKMFTHKQKHERLVKT